MPPLWSRDEEDYFSEEILPQSCYSTGHHVPDSGMEFVELVPIMQAELDRRGVSRRTYTGSALFQHWYQRYGDRSKARRQHTTDQPLTIATTPGALPPRQSTSSHSSPSNTIGRHEQDLVSQAMSPIRRSNQTRATIAMPPTHRTTQTRITIAPFADTDGREENISGRSILAEKSRDPWRATPSPVERYERQASRRFQQYAEDDADEDIMHPNVAPLTGRTLHKRTTPKRTSVPSTDLNRTQPPTTFGNSPSSASGRRKIIAPKRRPPTSPAANPSEQQKPSATPKDGLFVGPTQPLQKGKKGRVDFMHALFQGKHGEEARSQASSQSPVPLGHASQQSMLTRTMITDEQVSLYPQESRSSSVPVQEEGSIGLGRSSPMDTSNRAEDKNGHQVPESLAARPGFPYEVSTGLPHEEPMEDLALSRRRRQLKPVVSSPPQWDDDKERGEATLDTGLAANRYTFMQSPARSAASLTQSRSPAHAGPPRPEQVEHQRLQSPLPRLRPDQPTFEVSPGYSFYTPTGSQQSTPGGFGPSESSARRPQSNPLKRSNTTGHRSSEAKRPRKSGGVSPGTEEPESPLAGRYRKAAPQIPPFEDFPSQSSSFTDSRLPPMGTFKAPPTTGSPAVSLAKGPSAPSNPSLDLFATGSPAVSLTRGPSAASIPGLDLFAAGSPAVPLTKGASASPNPSLDLFATGSPAVSLTKAPSAPSNSSLDLFADGSPAVSFTKGASAPPNPGLDLFADSLPMQQMNIDETSQSQPQKKLTKSEATKEAKRIAAIEKAKAKIEAKDSELHNN